MEKKEGKRDRGRKRERKNTKAAFSISFFGFSSISIANLRPFIFSQQRIQTRLHPHLLWKWRCYDEKDAGLRAPFLLEHSTKPFCIFPSLQQYGTRHRALLFPRVESFFVLSFLHSFSLSPLFLFLFSFFVFLFPTHSLLFVCVSSKLLSEWLLQFVARCSFAFIFLSHSVLSVSQPLSGYYFNGYRPLLIPEKSSGNLTSKSFSKPYLHYVKYTYRCMCILCVRNIDRQTLSKF